MVNKKGIVIINYAWLNFSFLKAVYVGSLRFFGCSRRSRTSLTACSKVLTRTYNSYPSVKASFMKSSLCNPFVQYSLILRLSAPCLSLQKFAIWLIGFWGLRTICGALWISVWNSTTAPTVLSGFLPWVTRNLGSQLQAIISIKRHPFVLRL